LRKSKNWFSDHSRDGGRSGLPGEPLNRGRPKVEVSPAEARLQLDRALRIGDPVLGHLADGLDDVGDVLSEVLFDLALLARLHVGGDRLAAFLDHTGDVAGDRFVVDGPQGRSLGRFGNGFVHGVASAQEVARPAGECKRFAANQNAVRSPRPILAASPNYAINSLSLHGFRARAGRRKMRKAYVIGLAAVALALGGCSAAQVFEKLPQSVGGLSPDAPKAPDTPYAYPAVHDMPASRELKPLTDAEQLKLENDLLSARAAQEKAAAEDAQANQNPPAPPPPAAKTKKKPPDKAGSAVKP
jgi:hypothetical protein